MTMNGGVPTVNQSISTISAPEAAPDATSEPEAAPSAPEAAQEARKEDRDYNLELARKFETAAQRESRARRAEREAATLRQSLTEKEKRIAAREAELEEALGDPVGYMLKNGKDPVEVAKRYAQPETPEEKRIRKLEEQLEARAAEEAKQKEAWEQQQEEQAKFNALREFIGAITSEECPNLTTLYEASEVPSLVEELLHRPVDRGNPRSPTMIQAFYQERGRNPTDKEIRECLEYEAELRATRLIEHRRREGEQRAQVANSGGLTQDSAKTESGPNGISNKHAAATVSAGKRPLTLEEKRKARRRELTAALETDGGEE